jgi:hypothetical protein
VQVAYIGIQPCDLQGTFGLFDEQSVGQREQAIARVAGRAAGTLTKPKALRQQGGIAFEVNLGRVAFYSAQRVLAGDPTAGRLNLICSQPSAPLRRKRTRLLRSLPFAHDLEAQVFIQSELGLIE